VALVGFRVVAGGTGAQGHRILPTPASAHRPLGWGGGKRAGAASTGPHGRPTARPRGSKQEATNWSGRRGEATRKTTRRRACPDSNRGQRVRSPSVYPD